MLYGICMNIRACQMSSVMLNSFNIEGCHSFIALFRPLQFYTLINSMLALQIN